MVGFARAITCSLGFTLSLSEAMCCLQLFSVLPPSSPCGFSSSFRVNAEKGGGGDSDQGLGYG